MVCEVAQSDKLCTKDDDKVSLSIRFSLMLSLAGIKTRKYGSRRKSKKAEAKKEAEAR